MLLYNSFIEFCHSQPTLSIFFYPVQVFQFGTFNFCISFLTSSTQRVFGLPIGLLEMGFQEYIVFTILVPCTLSTWPSQLSLCARVKFIMFLRFIISSGPWLVFMRHIPFSFFWPNIFLKIFLSQILIIFFKFFYLYREKKLRQTTQATVIYKHKICTKFKSKLHKSTPHLLYSWHVFWGSELFPWTFSTCLCWQVNENYFYTVEWNVTRRAEHCELLCILEHLSVQPVIGLKYKQSTSSMWKWSECKQLHYSLLPWFYQHQRPVHLGTFSRRV